VPSGQSLHKVQPRLKPSKPRKRIAKARVAKLVQLYQPCSGQPITLATLRWLRPKPLT